MILEEKTRQDVLKEEQQKDPDIAVVKNCLEKKDQQNLPTAYKPVYGQLQIVDSVVYQVRKGESRILVPESWRLRVLQSVHNNNYAIHFGVSKTYAKLKSIYFWPYMFKDLKTFIKRPKNYKT